MPLFRSYIYSPIKFNILISFVTWEYFSLLCVIKFVLSGVNKKHTKRFPHFLGFIFRVLCLVCIPLYRRADSPIFHKLFVLFLCQYVQSRLSFWQLFPDLFRTPVNIAISSLFSLVMRLICENLSSVVRLFYLPSNHLHFRTNYNTLYVLCQEMFLYYI
nr:MAG TPA: hypothetical protein [Caudoviricetes sp.]